MEWWEEWQCMEVHEAGTEYWQRGHKAQENYSFIHVNCPKSVEFNDQNDQLVKGHIIYKCATTDDIYCGGCSEPVPSKAWAVAKLTGANVTLVNEEGKKIAVGLE